VLNASIFWDGVTLPWRFASAALETVRQRGFDRILLYGQTWQGLGASVRQFAKAGLPMVVDLAEWWRWGQGFRQISVDQGLFRRICMTKVSGIVGISTFWEEYARWLGKPMLRVPAMADEEFEDLGQRRSDAFKLVYVGMLFRRDLPQAMIDGVRLALRRGCQFTFVILGRANLFPEALRAVHQIQSDPLLSDNVEIAGWVERKRIEEVYRDAGAFLLLRDNVWESRVCFPTRLPEYLTTARPVITSDVGDASLYLRHKQNAWLLPGGHQPEKLAEAICQLAANREDGERIGQAGLDTARQELSFRHHGQRLRSFLDGLRA
jgi:glycosyltransferase involved in cell wall biosynthesis